MPCWGEADARARPRRAAAAQVRTLAAAFAGLAARVLWKLSPGEAAALAGATLGGHIKARAAPARACGVQRLCVVTGAWGADANVAQAVATWSPGSCRMCWGLHECCRARASLLAVSHACLHLR